MPYYPASQTKNNQSTNGGEYVLSTDKSDYVGYYYITSTGERYSGKNYKEGSNILLLSFEPKPPVSKGLIAPKRISVPTKNSSTIGEVFSNSSNYAGLNSNLKSRFLPTILQQPPKDEDYKFGEYTRYFCKKNNEFIYFEIGEDDFNKLSDKDSSIAWDLYSPANLKWMIKGTQRNVFFTNLRRVRFVESNKNWNGFETLFKNKYLQYYKSNYSISQIEKTQNSSNTTTTPPTSTGRGGY